MQTRFRDRVPRLIAELDHLEQDGMSSARKVALLYGTIIDDLIWASQNEGYLEQQADGIIEAYTAMATLTTQE